jgi:glucose/arabinose dehydrogenase
MRRSALIAATATFASVALFAACSGPATQAKSPAAAPASAPAAGAPAGYETKVVADGLANPWGLAVLPDGALLVTERNGGLKKIVEGASPVSISGVPEAFADGQGGLLDVALHPQFATNGLVYLSLSVGTREANATRLVRGKLEGAGLVNVETLWEAGPKKRGPAHFGARILWLPDGTLLLSLGDGFAYREQAQDLTNHFGKIVHLTDAGAPAPNNPLAARPGAKPDIYSYGHRNVQGLVRDPATGRIFAHEHGPQGGDELNLLQPGKNYGWPAITYGVDYSGAQISPFKERPGMEQPLVYWVPSIAPGGMAFYSGDAFPQWKGDVLVAALRAMEVRRVDLDADGKVIGQEGLFAELNARIRQVVQAPDGGLYLLTDAADGAVIKVSPKG